MIRRRSSGGKRILRILVCIAVAGGCFFAGTIWGSRHGVPWLQRYQDWSIGLVTGPSLLSLEPGAEPVLRASDVTDLDARFIADPFLLRVGGSYVMFFEAYDERKGKGDIAMATSMDGQTWSYGAVVLDEPFHLSYPYVFQSSGITYMVPESVEARAVFLYRAERFPDKWVRVRTLLAGRYVDPSLTYWADRWWLFVGEETNDTLRLFSAATLDERFVEHPESPLVLGDRNGARPAGRLLQMDSRLFRCAQDDRENYGTRVVLFEILTLSLEEYDEASTGFALQGDGSGWNAAGMHNLDVVRLDSEQWLGVTDGWSGWHLLLVGD